MITPATLPATSDIARHYDELDEFYREVWGEHVHHGLWDDDQDSRTAEEAALRLLERVTSTLPLKPGNRIADIGCGYGASSRWIAAQHSAHVVALTLSERQITHARQQTPPTKGSVEYQVDDWLDNSLPDASLDAAIAIESLAHMTDKDRFFQQLHRTLKPTGHASLAVWTSAEDPTPLERHLLGTICAEGRLPGIGSLNEYRQLAIDHGFEICHCMDLSEQVERTWWIITRRALAGLFTKPRYLRFILTRAFRKRIFVLTLPRLLLAYRTGALRYGLLTIKKSAKSLPPSA